jgi:VCBS repeat-containing protein
VFRGTCDAPGDDGAGGGYAHVTRAPPLQVIGTIQMATGLVTVMDPRGVVAQVDVGDPVYRHDTIETGPDGAVGITFTDGTAFNLSNNARMALNQFVCDGTSNSALFSLSKGAFAFMAGKVAKAGGLRIDTPFARIRGAAQDGGIGILTLAALAFSTIREIQAASRSDAFLDDGTITYKDSPHGTFEITTRDGRVIVADDPGETIVVDPAGSVTRMPNSSSRMAELQVAQANTLSTLSLGLGQQGAAPGGSSTPTFNIPLQLQPINFSLPQNNPAPLTITTINATPANQGIIDFSSTQPPLPPPPVTKPTPNPVLAADVSGGHLIIAHTTGSGTLDTTPSGVLAFTDFDASAVSTAVSSITWSGGPTPSGVAEALAGAVSSTIIGAGSDSGSIVLTFSAADNNFGFLAAGETLTIIYNVTVTDNNGFSLTQPVTVTVVGTNDPPVLAASGAHTIAKQVNTTGSTSPDTSSGNLTFTDPNLSDTHQASASAPTFAWSGGALTAAQRAALAAASTLTLSETDSTGSGAGSIAFSYSAADKTFDFLAFGQTLTITYNVTVTDNQGASSTQPVTITVIGTDKPPVLSNVAATASYAAVDSNPASSTPVTLSSALTVSDVDNQTLQSAKVAISSGFLTGDVLAANVEGTSITASYDPTTGVLTLSGNDTLAHYTQVLDRVTYSSTSSNPTNFGADSSRTITWVVNDGTLNSATATTKLTITVLDQDTGERLIVPFNGLTGGHAVEDKTITAIVTDSDNDAPTSGITYAWQISHDGGNTWSTVGANTPTYTPGEADEGGQLKVLVSFTDAAGNTESGSSTVGVLPLLTIANTSLSVSPNGSVSLGISLTQEPTPDDTISVTISGAHDPTIAAGDHATGNPHTSGGITTYTFSVADINSGLTFTNHGDQSDTLTVNEILNGNTVATSQTITVTDPPVFGGGTIVSDQPVSAPSENTSVQSNSAHDLIVSSLVTETMSANADRSAFLFKANLDHHITDPKGNFAQSNAENLLHLPAQPEDNGVHTVTNGAHAAHPHFDVNQSGGFKFADDGGSAHPAHAIGEDTSVQSTAADNGHHTIADSEINLASIAPNHLPDPADNSLHMPAQLDGNGVLTGTDGAHPTDLPVDLNQLPSFKFADDGSTHSAHATSKDPSLQSTLADNGHHAIADPEINLASIAPNHPPEHPPDNSLHMPAQLDGNGVLTVTDRAHPANLPVDVNQLPSFKFADDGSTHPGTVPYGQPTLTGLSGDLSGDHGPAAPALAKTFNVPSTVMSDAASDKFIFGKGFGHDTIADHKPDMTEIDHTVPAAIQHLLDTAHDTNAVSALDPNHASALQDMTKVQLPHHQGDFHFA